MIELRNVSYAYPQTETAVLQDITLSVPAGQFLGVVGPNEAGKSTLSYVLTGFVPHHFNGRLTGAVQVAGLSVPEATLGDLAGKVGLVFSNPFNQITGARFTVREEVAFGLENLGVPREEMIPRVERALAMTGLADLGERSPYALSGGQQQRLALASMLVMEPQVLVLDEPTSQLDPAGKKEVFAVLDQLSVAGEMTVVIIEHELEWIGSFVDRVVVLDEGRIIADGLPRDVLAAEMLIALGVGNTAYTKAARAARAAGKISHDEPLPVTLEQAVDFFRA
jgi:energy-coupling factor transporter ATP-binding protein EcfA2